MNTIKHDGDRWFSFIIDATVLALLDRLRVFSHPHGHSRWQPGAIVTTSKDFCPQPYSGVYNGDTLPMLGSFSYTFAPLGWDFRTGRYCSIAGGVRLMGNEHPTQWAMTGDLHYQGSALAIAARRDFGAPDHLRHQWNSVRPPPVIENDVWIGQDCTIRGGITIGNGAVIAAGSIVTKDVPPYAIVGGVPAKIIRMRFPEWIVARMLTVRPWQYAEPDIREFPIQEPERFLDAIENAVARGSLRTFSPPQPETLYEMLRRVG